MKRNADLHHEELLKKRVKVVHCCGYDSVPFDLGAYFLVDYVKKVTSVCVV